MRRMTLLRHHVALNEQETLMAHKAPRQATDELLSIEDLSAELKIPLPTLYTWRSRGKGPQGFRLANSHVRYRRSEVDRWLAECGDTAARAIGA